MNPTAIFTIFTICLVFQVSNGLSTKAKDLTLKSQALVKSYSTPDQFKEYCGGVVIHPRFVLTQFACIRNGLHTEVAVGNDKVTENSPWFVNDCSLLGENWNYMISIGILIFVNPINGGDVAIAKLAVNNSDILANDPVYVADYGTYGVDQIVPSLDLHIVEYKGMDRADCSKIYRPLVDTTSFCYFTEEKNACLIDFGSPVYSDDDTIVGLTLYRDDDECSERRPVVSHRFGSPVLQDIILSGIANNSWTQNCSTQHTFNNINQSVKLLKL